MDIREYLANNRLITDGAMGTWYDRLTGYKGNLAERANLENPQQIRDIHRAYIEAGARLIRTNTFAVNSMFFSADEKKICRKMTKRSDKDRFICYWLYHLLESLDLGGYTNDRCTGHSAISWHYKMLQRL